MFECEFCAKQFSRADNRNRHILSSCRGKRRKTEENSSTLIKCDVCDVFVDSKCYTAHIRSSMHRSKAFTVVDDGVKRSVAMFGGRIVSYQISGYISSIY